MSEDLTKRFDAVKNEFPEMFRPTEEHFKKLWTQSSVSFDASVLLHVLRFPKESAGELLALMRSLEERVWLPHQAAYEFLKNRHRVYLGLEKPFHALRKAAEESKSSLDAKLNELSKEYRHHPSIDIKAFRDAADRAFTLITSEFDEHQKKHPTQAYADEMVDAVAAIFSGKIGTAPTIAEVETWSKEAKVRYADNVPPGYKDFKSKEDGGIGDYFNWMQLISHAKSQQKSVLWITDDVKEDWYLEVSGKTFGPRPELIKEFRSLTGQEIYIYNLPQYLKMAQEQGTKISSGVIESAVAQVEQSTVRIRHRERQVLTPTFYMITALRRIMAQEGLSPRTLPSAYLANLDEVDLKALLLKANKLVPNEHRAAVRASIMSHWIEARRNERTSEGETTSSSELAVQQDELVEGSAPEDEEDFRAYTNDP